MLSKFSCLCSFTRACAHIACTQACSGQVLAVEISEHSSLKISTIPITITNHTMLLFQGVQLCLVVLAGADWLFSGLCNRVRDIVYHSFVLPEIFYVEGFENLTTK